VKHCDITATEMHMTFSYCIQLVHQIYLAP